MRWPGTNGQSVNPLYNHTETYNITIRRKFNCRAEHQTSKRRVVIALRVREGHPAIRHQV